MLWKVAGMRIRAVVFDIGGVLEITPATGWLEKWEKRLHMKVSDIDERLKSMGKDGGLGTCSEEEWRKGLREITRMDQAQVDEFMEELWTEYLGELNAELAAYFTGLRPRYKTALLSNSFLGARRREQERYKFSEMTDLIIYSHEVGVAKPERRIFELTCERLGVQPAEMAFLDDFEPNVTAAQESAIHAVLFRETRQAIADLEACLQTSAS